MGRISGGHRSRGLVRMIRRGGEGGEGRERAGRGFFFVDSNIYFTKQFGEDVF